MPVIVELHQLREEMAHDFGHQNCGRVMVIEPAGRQHTGAAAERHTGPGLTVSQGAARTHRRRYNLGLYSSLASTAGCRPPGEGPRNENKTNGCLHVFMVEALHIKQALQPLASPGRPRSNSRRPHPKVQGVKLSLRHRGSRHDVHRVIQRTRGKEPLPPLFIACYVQYVKKEPGAELVFNASVF